MNQLLELFNNRAFVRISLTVSFVAIIAVYLGGESRMAGTFAYGLDDSWIHATFARNLAEGKGFAFNPNEPISGSTSPLYTVMLTGWYAVTGDVIWGAKLIGIVSLALLCFLVFRSAMYLTSDTFTAWYATALSIFSMPFLFSALNGMETIVYLVTVAAVIYFYSRNEYRWMIILAALGVWLRPEGVLLLGIAWLLAVPKREKLITLILGTVIVLPYFYFNYAIGGHIFPHTVVAKQERMGKGFHIYFLKETWMFLTRTQFFGIFLLLPIGIRYFWNRPQFRWIVVFPFAFFLIYWATSITTASFSRYLYPMLPFFYIVMATAGIMLWNSKPERRIIVISGMMLLLLITAVKTLMGSNAHGLAVQNITGMQVSVGQTLPLFMEPTDTVATNDIGAIGYFSERYVVDLVGLVSPVRSFDENLRETHPAVLAIFDSWFPYREESELFVNNYIFLAKVGLTHNIVCGDSVMTIYARTDKYDEYVARLKSVPLEDDAKPN